MPVCVAHIERTPSEVLTGWCHVSIARAVDSSASRRLRNAGVLSAAPGKPISALADAKFEARLSLCQLPPIAFFLGVYVFKRPLKGLYTSQTERSTAGSYGVCKCALLQGQSSFGGVGWFSAVLQNTTSRAPYGGGSLWRTKTPQC